MNKINKVLVILLAISVGFIQNSSIVVLAEEITSPIPAETAPTEPVAPITENIPAVTPVVPTEPVVTSLQENAPIENNNANNVINLPPENSDVPTQPIITSVTTPLTTYVKVITHVVNDGPGIPGTAVAGNFQNRVIQDSVNEYTMNGYEEGYNYNIQVISPYYVKALNPGENDPLTPQIPTGYTATMSGDCGTSTNPITLASGDLKTCTVTYNDNGSVSSTEAYVKVYTNVINDGPGIVGTSTASDFVNRVTSENNKKEYETNGFTTGYTYILIPQTFPVTYFVTGLKNGESYEPGRIIPTNYTVSYGSDCGDINNQISLNAGDVRTCTVTYNDIGGEIQTDTVAPVIELIGDATVHITFGSTYEEKGANVKDNTDPNPVLTITGTVDTNTAGTYTIKYNAVDASGNNATEVTRTVIVDPKQIENNNPDNGNPGNPGSIGSSGSTGSTGSTGGIVTTPNTLGEVLGASTSCTIYINSYMRKGQDNNPTEVKKLQSFLNEYMDLNIPVTGYFGDITENAVKQFQLKHKEDILKPWFDAKLMENDYTPTGYVYKTTLRKINNLVCPQLNIPVPKLD